MVRLDLLELSATRMAELVRSRAISSVELVEAHVRQIEEINPSLNAVVELLAGSALSIAKEADDALASGTLWGPLHGVPFSIKDSIDVAGTRCTAGTLCRREATPAESDATLVARLRQAGGIPIAKTNLPDLLFSFETDNLIFGRSNNPYALERTPGGSSGGESALIAACGSPLGLGSDAFGSVRLPAAFCGIAGIKPTSGRLPRTGHVPPAGGWVEAVWQMGPMARRVEDLVLAMHLLTGEDRQDFTCPPVPLLPAKEAKEMRVAYFTDNGFAPCDAAVRKAVEDCAAALSARGVRVEEKTPPGIAQAYELEFAILGADAAQGIDEYLKAGGSDELHPLHVRFVDHLRRERCDAAELAGRWAQWDRYRAGMRQFFDVYDAVLCPAYAKAALRHGESAWESNFQGFSYTMAWNMAGAPAATVRFSEDGGLPVNVQVAARPWSDLTALALCHLIEEISGGWKPPQSAGTKNTSTGDGTSNC